MDLCPLRWSRGTAVGADRSITLVQLDDFILWVTIGIIVAAAPATCCSTIRFFFRTRRRSSSCGMAACHFTAASSAASRRYAVCPQERYSIPVARDINHRVGPIGLFPRAARQLHQQRVVGPCGGFQRTLGDGVPNGGPLPRHPSQLYEAGLEASCCLRFLAVMIRMGPWKRPGLILAVSSRSTVWPRPLPANSSATRSATRIFVGRG